NTGTYITSVKHQERTTFSEPSLTKIILPLQAICWDQWFPEAAILFYPTAIGSEPEDQGLDSGDHWRSLSCWS
ncbi:unnamed protein product, partial [Brassica oleracea]